MSFLLHKLVLKTFFSVFSVRNLQYGPRTRLVRGIEYRNVGAFYTCVEKKGINLISRLLKSSSY